MTREVPLEEGFVDRNALHADRLGLAVELHDAVDHQEGIAVGQDAHHLIDVHHRSGGGDGCRGHGKQVAVALGDRTGELRVGSVARLHRHDVAAERPPRQGKVADDIKDLVADELVGKAEGLLAQDGVTSDDQGILEAAPLDEPLLHEVLHILVVDEGAGRSDLAGIDLRGDLQG